MRLPTDSSELALSAIQKQLDGACQTRVVAFESSKLTQPERSYPPGPRT
jgi:hypothetical protein